MGDEFISITDFKEVADKIVSKIGDIGAKLDKEITSVKLEQGRLSTSISNVQTNLG